MTVLLVIVYISFISLGLPDSLLGAAWPVLHISLDIPQTYAGILSFTTSICTVIASLSSLFLNKKLGTGKTIALSTMLTSIALFGYSIAPVFWMLIPISIALGLGGGAIDCALNNYVALHYKSSHMSFLHAFWGLGATLGPMILTIGLSRGNYQIGYRIIASIQFCLAIIQLIFIKKFDQSENTCNINSSKIEVIEASSRDWTKYLAMLCFFFYCSIEFSLFIWVATFFVKNLGTSEIFGAKATSITFIGLTFGRFISGFVSEKIGVKNMIYINSILAAFGGLLFLLTKNVNIAILAVLIIGFGFAPLYPSMIHRTPRRFGSLNSPKIIGQQMASAYIGSSFTPAIMGIIFTTIGYKAMPFIIIVGSLLIFSLTLVIEKNNRAI